MVEIDTFEGLKASGDSAFRERQFGKASEAYEAALSLIDETDERRPAVLFNRGAALYHLSRFHESVKSCSQAIELKPDYVKALYRRAMAYSKLDQIEEASADFDRMFEIDPALRIQHKSEHEEIKKRVNAKMESEKEKMVSDLKNLGNSLLGHFGMTLSDFQKDPVTGSYTLKSKSTSQ